MLYLGTKYNKEKRITQYVFEQDPKSLSGWQKPIAIDDAVVPSETRDEILRILNDEGSFFIKECKEVKVAFGVGKNDFTRYHTIFGELEEKLEHEGPFFRGIDGRTEGYFKFNMLTPKTDLAIVLQKTSTSFYYEAEKRTLESITGKMYFLRKN